MRITEFTLEEYKPLLHNKIHRIHVTNISQITILTGPNGWGKSSILRELTPYPSTRSDYAKSGKKILHITHDKSAYVLTSDFSKTGAHSFIKDDIELNISGTTDVQTDLVNLHFNYSKTLDSLLLGNMKLTNMGRPARRELFMTTYPGSLGFVLNHFTRLSTMSRATASQLKLLKERQTKTSNKLIPEDTLKTYQELKSDLDKTVIQFDQNIFVCNNSLNATRANKSKLMEYAQYDIDYFNNELVVLKKELDVLHNTDGYDIVASDRLEYMLNTTSTILQSLTTEHKTLLQTGISINDEITKYTDYLKMDIKDSIAKCENIIEVQNKILKACKIDSNIPIMDEGGLNHIKSKLENISNLIHWLKAYGKHWTKKEHSDNQLLYAKQNMEVGNLNKLHTDLLNELGLLKTRYDNTNSDAYPVDCKRSCGLRESIEKTLMEIKSDIKNKTTLKDKIFKDLEILKTKQLELKNSLEGRASAEAKIEVLDRLFSHNTWGYYVLGNLDIVSALNSNSTDIWNKLQRLISNSENVIKIKQAKDIISVTNDKLETLKATEIPAKAIITETLVKKEVELKKIHERLDKIADRGKLIQHRRAGYNQHIKLLNKAKALNVTMGKWIEYKKLEADEQLILSIIHDLRTHKTSAHEKLRSIESIIMEQQGYLTILNNELLPTIQELEDKLKTLSIIVEQLSPVSGIPYKYTIQYINDLFNLANKYIRHIWEHDLELVYFTDNVEFDFIFKLLINNASELKDINMCSKGQKSLIDLVVNLAICIYRGYANTYPLKLDEIDDGMTPTHQAKLTEFLGELLQQNTINQVFIMNHHLSVSSSFKDAGVISLSNEDIIPSNCKVISIIN